MSDISGFGIQVQLIASVTFPNAGFIVTQFADDSDPLDMGSVKIGELTIGLNGDPISYAKAVALPMVLNVIPGSDNDANLQILADAVRVSKGKFSSLDEITAIVSYPDGRVVTLTGGRLTDAMFGNSVSSAGRLKTKTYAFSFPNKAGA